MFAKDLSLKSYTSSSDSLTEFGELLRPHQCALEVPQLEAFHFVHKSINQWKALISKQKELGILGFVQDEVMLKMNHCWIKINAIKIWIFSQAPQIIS